MYYLDKMRLAIPDYIKTLLLDNNFCMQKDNKKYLPRRYLDSNIKNNEFQAFMTELIKSTLNILLGLVTFLSEIICDTDEDEDPRKGSLEEKVLEYERYKK